MTNAAINYVHYSTLSSPTNSEATSNGNFSPPTPALDSTHHVLSHGMATSNSKATVGDSILRQYAHDLGSLHTDDETHAVHDFREQGTKAVDETALKTALNLAKTPVIESIRSSYFAHHPTVPVPKPLSLPKPFLAHRKNAKSIDLPKQTIMKALASRRPSAGPTTAPLAAGAFKSAGTDADLEQPNNSSTSSCFTATLPVLQPSVLSGVSPTSTSFLRSPCFFHQRFEGVVDVQKVLDEIAEDDYSHSRLMQTAIGVREVSKQLQRKPLKRAVRNVMIVTKARDNSLVHLTRDLAEWLLSTPRYGSDLGVNVYVDAKLRHSKRFDAAGLLRKQPRFEKMLKYWTPDLCWSSPESFDLVLTMGGDGTVLFTSWLFQRVVPPVLSFSLGSLGFLTNFEFEKYKEHLDRVMGEVGMRVNLRMRFTCTVWRADRSPGAEKGAAEEGEQFEVLNELVIDRGPSAYVSNLELYGDDELLTLVQADGCIFSTPTGSTAYSLSAGGSLIHPSIPAILLTPICPHSLSFRPMVLSDTLLLRIAVPNKSRSSAYCSFDGKGRVELKRGDYVTLEASQYPFPTVMTGTNEWVESVQKALRWNVRGAVQKGWDDGDEEDNDQAEEKWDIDIDSSPCGGTDSGIGPSEDGDHVASPTKGQQSLLNL
ncbi:NAD(+) kinase [Elasticomyces elasticus]|uniref:NAD(+) kinase n=1 Tax=Exophiala sideris TaxID=1016849 RepID=A0ABR0JPS1_9EURO|nr:NAD(+) kinase [Elasticomyces elasticus]KAK5039593.1 NAD(+) kinase [Exophiala sideris]KAK5041145.1 NAD(+) kinase [Exophiala sideris]KAK5067970.1 NAD(+) kinase [Exophiala sideris]KAK5187272.1 NAD(+) kinase [Eurotiomycetes sp. CCFEE 6388]